MHIDGVEGEQIDELASGRSHGGVIGLVGPRSYLTVDELLLAERAAPNGAALLVMLDGIEDPYNLGQAIRALYAAGVDGLVMRRRNWESAVSVVTRASAGTSELLPTAVVTSVEEAASACRAAGLQVACAVGRDDGAAMHDVDLRAPTFLLIGGERRGVTRSFIEQADLLLRVPYGRQESPELGTAVAAAVIAFESLRQRNAGSAPDTRCTNPLARQAVGSPQHERGAE